LSKNALPFLPADLVVERLLPAPDRVVVVCHVRSAATPCPVCGRNSSRVHSRYQRKLADLPWQGRIVSLACRTRRLHCGNAACPRRIFAERLPGVAAPHARRTPRLGDVQGHLGAVLGGEPGARLAKRPGMTASGDTLLRLVRVQAPATPAAAPRVLGVDDWAWRRGHRYGTILVDLERGAVVDLLPDREADGFAAWPRDHPGVEVIARDRGAVYADGGRRGAPKAIHVADRWHLLENCGAAVLAAVRRHMPAVRSAAGAASEPLTAPSREAAQPSSMTSSQQRQWMGWRRRMETHGEVMSRCRAGIPIKQIARDLDLSRNTVRRWLRGEPPDPWRSRMDSLDPWRPLLERRWTEGCRNGARLWREARDAGFTGGLRVVTEWASRQRLAAPAMTGTPGRTTAPAPPLAARRVARMLTTDPASLGRMEGSYLERLLARSSALRAVRDLSRRFAAMVRGRNADALGPWLAEAADSELSAFAQGLRQDEAAVRAALTLPWSSGAVEGNVTRLRLIKRQGYGRAGFDLLRARILHAA
jgi:transposase